MTHRAFTLALAFSIAPLALPPGRAAAQPAPQGTEKLGAVVEEQVGANKDASASQERIDKIDDETQAMLVKYLQAKAETESIRAYADQLAVQIQSQNQEIASIQKQLVDVETFSRDVLPTMQRMLASLGQFVELDVPFLLEERRKRVASLEEVMTRADVTISEKYRRILEAYQIEMEYGRTIEAYEGRMGEGDDARTVQFLRVGRVSLMYQTMDGKETGYWDADQKSWVVDDDYRHAFIAGLRVAKKLGAPDMLIVPVPAPKEARS
jgi:hypothetical protein